MPPMPEADDGWHGLAVAAVRNPLPAAPSRCLLLAARRALRCQADPEGQPPADADPTSSRSSGGSSGSSPGNVREALRSAEAASAGGGTQGRRRAAESTDGIATALTRRFGLAGGLAWVGFLAFGVIGEQVKTRLEIADEEANTREVGVGTARRMWRQRQRRSLC